MSKATTTLMKRYIAVLNITNGNRYLGSEDVQVLLLSNYGIDVARRVVQRDLNDLYSVGAIERKGNAPISWRSSGIAGWAEIMRGSMKELILGEDYVELKESDLAQMNSVAISKYIDRLEQMYYDKKTVAMYYYSQAYNDERSQEED